MIYIWDTIETQNTIKSYVSYQCSQFKTHKNDTKDNLLKHPVKVQNMGMFIANENTTTNEHHTDY
jgi:hypothetical protein